jgi:hypothetical protein
MHRVSLVGIMIIVWAVLTTVWIALLIYRSVGATDESDQLFLDQAEESLEREQQAAIHKEKRIGAYLNAFGIASILMLVSTVSVWILRGLGA